jgi:hypothetical protein
MPVLALAAALTTLSPATATAAPITHFTWAFTDNFFFFSDAVFRTDGTSSATTQSGANDDANAAGRGAADLAAGTLRALAYSRSDPGYLDGGDTETWVGFGDSFRTFTAGGAPFFWAGASATMRVDLTGFRSSSGASPYNVGAIAMCVLPAGGLDAFATAIRANNYVEGDDDVDVCLYWQGYSLGPGDGDFPALLTFPATVDFTFTPGGDFDWFVFMALQVSSDNGGEALADFSNTAHASYTGPDGTVTRSASGLFPGTSPLEDIVAVPEPATVVLTSLGVALLAGRRGRRPRS